MLCLEAIGSLEPAPYDDEPFQVWCLLEAIRIFKQHQGFPDIVTALPDEPATSESAATPATDEPVDIYVFMKVYHSLLS